MLIINSLPLSKPQKFHKNTFVWFIVGVLLTDKFYHFSKKTALFDGKTFKGWEGDTLNTWQIENGMLVGSSLEKAVLKITFFVQLELTPIIFKNLLVRRDLSIRAYSFGASD